MVTGLATGAGSGLPVRADGLPVAAPQRAEPVRFEAEIRPFLAANCTACHNEKIKEGGLRLDSVAALVAGGDSGAGVVAGTEGLDRRREAILVGKDRLVAHVLPGLRREQGMDARRLAVADRISKHGVAIGHSVGSQAIGIGEGPGAGDFKDVGITPDGLGKRGIGCRHAHDAARRFIKQVLSR